MASENDPTTPDTAADAVPAVDAPEAASEKPKRRRATKKAAAPAAEPDAGAEVATDAEPAADVADGEGAPAKKATRKRAAKKTATKAAAKSPAKRAKKSAAAQEPTAADESTPDVPVADDAELPLAEVDDELTEVDGEEPTEADGEEPTEADADEVPAAAPSFGVLFQAPEPVTTRRRRATSPAQAPAERVAEEEPAAADTADAPTADSAEETEPPTEGRSGRRSRGGRGSRGARAERAETTDAAEGEAQDGGDDSAPDGDRGPDERSTDEGEGGSRSSRRRRGGRGRRGRSQGDDDATGTASEGEAGDETGGTGPADQGGDDSESSSSRRRRRRRRGGASGDGDSDDPPGTTTRVREPRSQRDEPTAVKGSTRLEAKKQRRREGREAGRRRTIITEAEFLARRESVERVMVVRGRGDRTQIGVLEDGVLVEHYVSRETTASMAGNVYLGRVQNVLPSMEAAFVDIGKGRNAVLYAGEVNWDAAGLEGGQARRIENALSSGDTVLTQVTKDPIGHKGARLTSQISLPGRYLVYVPEGQMTGISRKLPDTERARLKAILKEVVPDHAGVIVRTAAEGASEEELRADVDRLTKTWDKIKGKADSKGKAKGGSPSLVHGEPDLTVRVIRDVFNEDFTSLVVAGDTAYGEVSDYLGDVAPDLAERLQKWTSEEDLFTHYRVDEQIAKAMDRKVWLPSGGSLVIDRTEAMTVVDVNTGKFVGSGGNLEETVTKNNIEAAEEIVRQLRLRDIGGIIVIDFIDMVLESNRDLVVRRLLECLGRDRTKHQVAEVTSLGLVQMTRKRVGSGLIEVFSENCEHCGGRRIIVHADPVDKPSGGDSRDSRDSRDNRDNRDSGSGGQGSSGGQASRTGRGRRGRSGSAPETEAAPPHIHSGPTPAQIAAAAHAAALKSVGDHHEHDHVEHDLHDDALEPEQAAPQDSPSTEVLEALDQEQPEAVFSPEPEQAPEPAPAPEPVRQVVPEPVAAAPKRRKRGRVVAPAGPPRALPGEGDGVPSAEVASEQS
jgi:ribonuclease E